MSADRHLVSGLEGHYAGFVTRFGAFLVDIIVIAIVFAIGGRVLEFVLGILTRHRFELSAAGPGKTRVKWSSTFDADGAPDDKAKEAILGIYDAGLGKLATIFRE